MTGISIGLCGCVRFHGFVYPASVLSIARTRVGVEFTLKDGATRRRRMQVTYADDRDPLPGEFQPRYVIGTEAGRIRADSPHKPSDLL